MICDERGDSGHERGAEGVGMRDGEVNKRRSIVVPDESPESPLITNRPLLHLSFTLFYVDPLRLSRCRRVSHLDGLGDEGRPRGLALPAGTFYDLTVSDATGATASEGFFSRAAGCCTWSSCTSHGLSSGNM